MQTGDFTGGPVVKNPPSNAGDMGSIPGDCTFQRTTKPKSCKLLKLVCHN